MSAFLLGILCTLVAIRLGWITLWWVIGGGGWRWAWRLL